MLCVCLSCFVCEVKLLSQTVLIADYAVRANCACLLFMGAVMVIIRYLGHTFYQGFFQLKVKNAYYFTPSQLKVFHYLKLGFKLCGSNLLEFVVLFTFHFFLNHFLNLKLLHLLFYFLLNFILKLFML